MAVEEGEPGSAIFKPRYATKALRHFAASCWIAAGDGPKQIQLRMGHASIQTTMDIYGHLWRDRDADQAITAAAERMVFDQIS